MHYMKDLMAKLDSIRAVAKADTPHLPLFAQVVAKDGTAWHMEPNMDFISRQDGGPRVVITLKHPELETMPKIAENCKAEDKKLDVPGNQQYSQMMFDPATGEEHPYPSHAWQYRKWHGAVAWLINPWTGEKRDPMDIGTDVHGLLIIPPGEPLFAK